MRKLLILWLLMAPSAWSATYYASQTGSGSTCSLGSPCTVAGAIALPLVAGDTLYLLDGVYTGANSMISATGLIGTSGAGKITIQAQNDGAVWINGEAARIPVYLKNTKYIVVQGLAGYNSNQSNVYIGADPEADGYNEIKRVMAWNAHDASNNHNFDIEFSHHNLIEDCGEFGTSRKGYANYGGDNCTNRRNWGRWNNYNDTQPKQTYDLVYETHYSLYENCIGEWDELASDAGDNMGIMNTAGGYPYDPDKNTHLQVLGCISLALTAFNSTQIYNNYMSHAVTGSTFTNVVSYIEMASSAIYPFYLADDVAAGASAADHLTSIYGTGGTASVILGKGDGHNWTNTNFLEQATVGAYNMYTNTGAGATIRYRTVDGVLTSTPLWPWPMNDRISAARVAAGYAAYSVDTTIQAKFGTYPSEAGTSNTGSRIRVRRPE